MGCKNVLVALATISEYLVELWVAKRFPVSPPLKMGDKEAIFILEDLTAKMTAVMITVM